MNNVPRLVDVTNFLDHRGGLCVMEGEDFPFPIRRIYYIFDVPLGEIRGKHGHKRLEQLMICMNGACEVTLDNGFQSYHFKLEVPMQALYVPAGMWRQLRFQKPSTALCVLASEPYDKDDYLFTYKDFQRWAQEKTSETAEA